MYLRQLAASVLVRSAGLFGPLAAALPLFGCAAIQNFEEHTAAFSVGAVSLDFVDASATSINAQWGTFRTSLSNSLGSSYTPTKKD